MVPLPKKFYIHMETDDGEVYPVTMDSLADASDINDPDRKIGVYVLQEAGTAKTNIEFVPDELDKPLPF